MAKEKLEELSTEILVKRRKFVSILIVVMLVVEIIAIATLIFDLISDKNFNAGLLAAIMGVFATSVPLLIGKKKLDEEIKKRENKESHPG